MHTHYLSRFWRYNRLQVACTAEIYGIPSSVYWNQLADAVFDGGVAHE